LGSIRILKTPEKCKEEITAPRLGRWIGMVEDRENGGDEEGPEGL
jgi:hypothetical protein